MGYYSRFYIQAIDLSARDEMSIKDAQFFNQFGFDGSSPISAGGAWTHERCCKPNQFAFRETEPSTWHKYEDELVTASGKYPQVVFIVDREGEESGDIQRDFFLGGKLIKTWQPDITPPEWSAELLLE